MQTTRPMKVTVLGLSIDLGLLAEYRFHPRLDLRHGLLLLRIANAIFWTLVSALYYRLRYPTAKHLVSRRISDCARRRFAFLTSKQNFYEHAEGYVARLSGKYGVEVELTNQSAISNTLSRALKHSDELPRDQDLFFIHLGGMDYLLDVPLLKAARSFRLILEEIGQRNPDAYVVVIGPPDFVRALTSPCNQRKVLDTWLSPRVAWLQRALGFSTGQKLWPGAAEERVAGARRSLGEYERMLRHELSQCLRDGSIRAGCFVEQLQADMFYQDLEQRKRLFSFDGIHLSEAGVARLIKHQWRQLEPALERAHLERLLSGALPSGTQGCTAS